MKAYKGFTPDMTCRGFQYEEGKTYEEDEASLCNKGFHACLAPLDVFRFYPPCDDNGTQNKFHEVELEEVSDERDDDDTKVCAKKIKIGAELNFFGLAKAHVEWAKEQVDKKKLSEENGDYSAATNTGYCSAATNTGARSAATVKGKDSIAVAWGVCGKAKAALGSYIVLAEWVEDEDGYKLKCAKMHKVDNKTIKPDTFYTLKDGEFVEVMT